MTRSLYIGLVSISSLARFLSTSSLRIFGILFINSVSGLSELVTKGIFVIDVTESIFSTVLISLDRVSINRSVSEEKIFLSLSVKVKIMKSDD